ncbi:CDP-alcohol phosphatidyltransferase family protein [Salinarimonas ramus]|uniref:CDP-diacylglycerol--glycerol-3-phosphate 3-phosphatidyltransferase n=1 Tax=Salinarimonas ramus TaxID=690164 RepID=A0A917Q983_9HYPH|nr:CDP-alcohol phosphatidyltransferase family protein [Salinarimonas ramus]GGK36666.1 CDP-diacylglycerol--glycerol-3-phosphate 3-phosphatidyltransferase [Salinarimonas ramus]
MTIPNLISVFRLLIVPVVIVAILEGEWLAAFVLFLVAGISDGLDGWIARRFDMRSELGAVIDPLADKALLVSIYVTLAIVGAMEEWLVVIVVSRDVMIVLAYVVSWIMDRPISVKPIFASKVNTALLITYAVTVLASNAFAFSLGPFDEILSVGIAILTAFTLATYLVVWLRHMSA